MSRIVAVAALIVATTVVAVTLLGADSSYRVEARFETASQLVRGNEVQIGGRRVGLVKDIGLADNGQAKIVLEIEDETYAPLREGTQAVVRQASLAGVANRFVDLRMASSTAADIPDGGIIPARHTVSAVDLDQLFSVFDPETSDSLAGVIEGQARAWRGRSSEAEAGLLYLNPALAATNRLLSTLNREPEPLARFLVASSRVSKDLADERESLSSLVTDAGSALGAVAEQATALDESLGLLPPTLRRANTTFVNLRGLLDDLDPLVDAAGPAARALSPFSGALRRVALTGRPTLRRLNRLVARPGRDNDLLEILRRLPAVRDDAVGPVTVDGESRPSTATSMAAALEGLREPLAYNRPYAPELTSWFDTFSHTGIYDATGGTGRIAFHFGAYQEVNGRLALVPPELRSAVADQVLQQDQRNRCPGGLERGSAYKPTADFNCDLRQQPLGP